MNNNRKPTFTRGHLDQLASWVSELPDHVTRVQVASGLADVLQRFRHFDREKFMQRALEKGDA